MTKQAFQYIARGDSTEANDCSVRAVQVAGSMTYEQAHALMERVGRQKGRGVPWHMIDAVARANLNATYVGCSRGTTLAAFMRAAKQGQRYMVLIKGHVFAVVDGVQFDLTPPSGRCHVQGYWAIENNA